jgi:hypothetical protein
MFIRHIKSVKLTTGLHLGAWMTRYAISQYDTSTGKSAQSNIHTQHNCK